MRGQGVFLLEPKLSGMNDQQRNRTLFECIRDRCEETALYEFVIKIYKMLST
jgi:hypothetical protein